VTGREVSDLNESRLGGHSFDGVGDPIRLPALSTEYAFPAAEPETVDTLLSAWARDGAIERVSTGLPTLDDATRGGAILGDRWVIQGAPDAAKTLLLVQLLHTFAVQGLAVGLLAVDEEPGDVLIRLAQRCGFDRDECEARVPETLSAIRAAAGELKWFFYGADWTIESAATHLAAQGTALNAGTVLGVDSLQAARSETEAGRQDVNMTSLVDHRVRAIRLTAKAHGHLVLATSEMTRDGYRARRTGDRIAPLAAGKHSGSIEYSARVLLSLQNVGANRVQLEVPKNKHGTWRLASEGNAITLELDRDRQTLAEAAEADEVARHPGRDSSAKLEAMKRSIVRAVLKSRASGTPLRKRDALFQAVRGAQRLKTRALRELRALGAVTGGGGSPFEINEDAWASG